jgi:hypothetical protein
MKGGGDYHQGFKHHRFLVILSRHGLGLRQFEASVSVKSEMVRQRTRPLPTFVCNGLPYPVPVVAGDYRIEGTPWPRAQVKRLPHGVL